MVVVSDDDRPTGFWLQVVGCPNGPSWADAEYTVDDSMLLGRGWKSFARSHRLTRGQYLAFEYDGDMTLCVKIYRTNRGRVECCVESDSSSCIRSFGEDEEDSPSVKAEEMIGYLSLFGGEIIFLDCVVSLIPLNHIMSLRCE